MKKMYGNAAEIIMGVAVVIFLGFQSINFFMFVFPPDQWYMSVFGFALTSGGLLAYLVIFLIKARTRTEKFVAMTMMGVCLAGEIATAYFGMEISGWEKLGYTMTEADFSLMLKVVNLLALLHGLALLAYIAGDRIVEAFRDEDGDGVPNLFDPDYRSNSSRVYPSEVDPTHRQQS